MTREWQRGIGGERPGSSAERPSAPTRQGPLLKAHRLLAVSAPRRPSVAHFAYGRAGHGVNMTVTPDCPFTT